MCDCNFFCKILCTIVLVIAFLFNTLGNWMGVGDIIPTESCPFDWCVEETTEEETTEDTSQEGTTAPSTTEVTEPSTEVETTTTTTTAPTTLTTTTTRPTTTTTTLPTTTTTRYSTTQPPETDAGPHIQDATQLSLEVFGGSGDDIINGTASTSDGGFVICGTTTSQDGSFAKLYTSGWKSPYGFVAKYTKAGKLAWVKAFASTSAPITLEDVTVLSNGTIIAVGYTKATDYAANKDSSGTIDAIILKLASNGYMSAKKCLGGKNTDMFSCVEAVGNNFVVGGKSYSQTGDFAHLKGDSAILMSFNANLDLQWQTQLHGNAASTISDVAVDDEGNIFATCLTSATTGDFAEYKNSGGYTDTLVLKYNSSGEKQWGHMISSTARDEFGAIAPDGKGGCVVAGYFELASSPITDGSLGGVHHCGGIDALVFRINSNGTCRWIKTLSGFEDDFITDIVKTDGGFAVAGYSKSSNREFAEAGNEGLYDGFISFINTNGTTVKTFTHAGSEDDMAECLVYTTLGNICVMGKTKSSDVDFAELNTNSNAAYIGYIGKYQIEVQ